QITGDQPTNLIKYIEAPLKAVSRPVFFSFLYLLGGFLLLKMLGLNVWLSMAGAIAFSFASYNFIIIVAGHNTKAIAIAYIMPLLGSIILAFRKNRWAGAVLAALFLALAIRANHLQILYYTLFIVIIFFISELIFAIREKHFAALAKTSGVLIVAALLAIAANAGTLLTTYEYGKYTMRGDATGLTTGNAASQGGGLEADYITQWSYGVGETMTLLIPDFRGGASGGALDMDSATASRLKTMGVPEQHIAQFVQQLPLYWGTQPGTSGPVYFGAIVCFLFVMGLFLVEGRYKWWLLSAVILSVLLAWGKNFMPFTQFFIDYVPLYNKFRAVSMTLVIAGVCMPILGFLALKNIFEQKVEKAKILSALKWSAGITGGICLLFALVPSLAGNFVSSGDVQFMGDYEFLRSTLPQDRMALLSADAWRSFVFIALAAAALYLFVIEKLKAAIVTTILGALMLVDLWGVSKRYLNDSHFVERELLFSPVKATAADKAILADTDPDFRVLDLTKDPFNDATPSYFHKNIGGYSAVKMRRFQDLIDFQLQPEIAELYSALQTAGTLEELNETLKNQQVLNMMNMRYLILNPDVPPVRNEFANGNAWFVNDVHIAENADEEMAILSRIDTKEEMVVDKTVPELFYDYAPDSLAQIHLTHYSPNRLTYIYKSASPQWVVFSEIYYDKGWRAFVNGEEVPYFRANYVLRAMQTPAGNYEIEFRFEPVSYRVGNWISLVASLVLIGGLLVMLGLYFFKKQEKE
ncbi:MAG: YfhO family protein, partial [Prevotellaceae bacterium]|nr:YfhO family protein [Prevotellaceae bacterium]